MDKRYDEKELAKDVLLIETLEELSDKIDIEKSEQKEYFYSSFKEIYSSGYRHKYSLVYTFIISLTHKKIENQNCQKENTNERIKESILVTLTANLQNIAHYARQEKNDKDIYLKLRKLYDHVSLEAARKSTYENLLINYEQINIEIERIKKTIEESYSKAKELQKEVESSKKEYVSILGIFASIVLGFTGALSFTNSVFSNLTEVSISKLFIAIISVGAVIIKLLKMLLDLIYYSIGKEKQERNENRPKIIQGVIIGILISVAFSILFRKKGFTNIIKYIIKTLT